MVWLMCLCFLCAVAKGIVYSCRVRNTVLGIALVGSFLLHYSQHIDKALLPLADCYSNSHCLDGLANVFVFSLCCC